MRGNPDLPKRAGVPPATTWSVQPEHSLIFCAVFRQAPAETVPALLRASPSWQETSVVLNAWAVQPGTILAPPYLPLYSLALLTDRPRVCLAFRRAICDDDGAVRVRAKALDVSGLPGLDDPLKNFVL